MFYLSAAYIVKTMISGGNLLKEYIEERAVAIANYIIDYNATVRQTARKFGISKSTVHKDVTDRLENINPSLAAQARVVLDINKAERHIRGGMATKEKYQHQLQACSSYPETGIRNQERVRSHRRTQPFLIDDGELFAGLREEIR